MYDLVREFSWTASGAEGRPSKPNKDFVCMTDGHDDREKDRQPDEPQETNNVIFHPAIGLCQQLFYA